MASWQLPSATGALQLPPPVAVTPTSPVGVPAPLVTSNRTVMSSPGAEGSFSSDVMRVAVVARSTVTVGCCASVTPPANAVNVLAPALVALKLNLTTPSLLVLAEVGEIVLPVPEAARLTATPCSAAPDSSTTVTVTSVRTPSPIAASGTTTVDLVALGTAGGVRTVCASVSPLPAKPSAPA